FTSPPLSVELKLDAYAWEDDAPVPGSRLSFVVRRSSFPADAYQRATLRQAGLPSVPLVSNA
ncbi:MAG TPA: hypothetical protein VMF13_24335, partial [Luteitalea sp.]|nr:hypothetical protein [Luteitalea sp.]